MAVLIAERPAPVLQHSALLHTLGVELRVDPAICGYCALAIALACSSEVRVDLSDEIALCALIRTIAIDVLRLRRSGARRAETSVDLFALARSAVFRGVSAAPTAPIVTEVDVSRVLASRASSRVHLMRAVLVGALDPLTLRRGFAERDFADPAERAFVERERPFRAAREAFFFESYCTGNPKLRFAADWCAHVCSDLRLGGAIAVVCNFGGHFAAVRVARLGRSGEVAIVAINTLPEWSCLQCPQGHMRELQRLFENLISRPRL